MLSVIITSHLFSDTFYVDLMKRFQVDGKASAIDIDLVSYLFLLELHHY